MLNKILIFGGISLAAILVVENMVIASWTAYIFLARWGAGVLSIVSIIIWWAIGFWIKWIISDKNKYDDDRMDF